jgi:hypothetical protein
MKINAAAIGAKIETAIKEKYHLGTFDCSIISTIKEMTKIKKKINEKTIVIIEPI